MNKKIIRIRRATRTRKKIFQLKKNRLVIHRTSKHIYAQIISSIDAKVLITTSTLDKSISKEIIGNTGNKKAAKVVGKIIAKRAVKNNIINVSFDRSGFKYHGRIKSLADSARKYGLKF